MYICLAKATLKSDIADLALRFIGSDARKEVVRSAGPADLVIDLCTGTGSVLIEYARCNPNSGIIAIDSDAEILELVKRRFEKSGFDNITCIAAEATALPIDSASCDLVNISFGLHENNREERDAILKECNRILKNGGRLIITDYREAKGFTKSLLMHLYLRLFEPDWTNELFHGGLAREVESAGFEIKEFRTDIPMTQLILAKNKI